MTAIGVLPILTSADIPRVLMQTDFSTNGPIVGASSTDLPLDMGEKCLWKGQPPRGLMFRAQDIFLVPFTILWCGFAIFWEASVTSSSKAPAFFVLWGAGFVAVGLYLVFGRFIVDALIRARTVYGVTNRRILIVSGLRDRRVQSLSLMGLSEIELQEQRDGRGTITFGRQFAFGGLGRGWPGATRNVAPAFEKIDDAGQVYNLIRRAQQDLGTPDR